MPTLHWTRRRFKARANERPSSQKIPRSRNRQSRCKSHALDKLGNTSFSQWEREARILAWTADRVLPTQAWAATVGARLPEATIWSVWSPRILTERMERMLRRVTTAHRFNRLCLKPFKWPEFTLHPLSLQATNVFSKFVPLDSPALKIKTQSKPYTTLLQLKCRLLSR